MLLPKRVWKDIEGFEGLYQVSNDGKVRSLGNNKSRKTKILKQVTNNCGYKLVGLYKNGKGKFYTVHRLVAQAFISNPNNWPQVNHKNEVKDDNRVCNLEWCTQEYNCNYGTRNERQSKTRKGIIYTETNKEKHYNISKRRQRQQIRQREEQRQQQIQQQIQQTLRIYNEFHKDCK